jgi:hypothetical protein
LVSAGKSKMLGRRAAASIIVGLFCFLLQGCALFGVPNAVREGRLDGQAATQIVYGLDASRGGLSVALDWFDPVTGKSGTCSQHDHTEASAASGSAEVMYFVFDAPPGAYTVSRFNTTGGVSNLGAPAYRVPSGRQVYIGTFSVTRLHNPARDLELAKRAIGPAAARLELAEVFVPASLQRMTVCSP